MAWRLPVHARRTYPRNPLEAVVVQLRFDPILKIRDGVADFQEGVRHRFPEFEEQITQSFEINPAVGVRTRQEPEFRFRATDGSATAFLSTHAVALETRAHIERDPLLADFTIVMDSMRSTYESMNARRLGLRYINAIDRMAICGDLGREVGWTELIAEDFTRVPCDLADLEGMAFGAEFSSNLDRGRMTLRYGMLPEAKDRGPRFRLDIDRYCEGDIDMSDIHGMLVGYAADIYSVFESAAGPSLREWMDRGEPNDD